MKTVAIIQARLNSTRLPQKILLPMAGQPMLKRIVERVKRAKLVDEVVVAIPSDDIMGIMGNQGPCSLWHFSEVSENDLVGRFYECAKTYKADVVVRICADNSFVDPELIDMVIEEYRVVGGNGLLVTNMENPNGIGSWPDGVGAEVYSMKLLEFMDKHIKYAKLREHPHRYFYQNDIFSVMECPLEIARPDIRLDVNTKDDYDRMKLLFETVYEKNPEFTTKDVISAYDSLHMGQSQDTARI